ncbi:glycosyltransferase family 2 protein, partial [Curtobacterium sp. B8]
MSTTRPTAAPTTGVPTRYTVRHDPELAAAVLDDLASLPDYRPTIGCVIPAYNEAESIAAVLDSLLAQTRVPDVVHVVINNTTDATFDIAAAYAGPHRIEHGDAVQETEVYVHDIGENPDKKVGALNYGFSLIEGCDYMLGVDGDTTAHPEAVEWLAQEIVSDARIGGISAIYSIDDAPFRGLVPRFLIAGQRAQFAAFNM